jgi:hypothetical protein
MCTRRVSSLAKPIHALVQQTTHSRLLPSLSSDARIKGAPMPCPAGHGRARLWRPHGGPDVQRHPLRLAGVLPWMGWLRCVHPLRDVSSSALPPSHQQWAMQRCPPPTLDAHPGVACERVPASCASRTLAGAFLSLDPIVVLSVPCPFLALYAGPLTPKRPRRRAAPSSRTIAP